MSLVDAFTISCKFSGFSTRNIRSSVTFPFSSQVNTNIEEYKNLKNIHKNIYNIYENNLEEIWHSEKHKQILSCHLQLNFDNPAVKICENCDKWWNEIGI